MPVPPSRPRLALRKTRDRRVVRPSNDFVNVVNCHWRMRILAGRGKEYGEVHFREKPLVMTLPCEAPAFAAAPAP